MNRSNSTIFFWQQIVSPHMGYLASALAEKGYKVYFIANQILSESRLHQGWEDADIGKAILKLAIDEFEVKKLALNAPKNSLHIFQGLRGNGLVANALKILKKKNLRRWIILERLDNIGMLGKLRKLFYFFLFLYWDRYIDGILAIGIENDNWFVSKVIKQNKIYPFAYFIKEINLDRPLNIYSRKKYIESNFRFIFVGQLIRRKNIELIIHSLSNLNLINFELLIVGDGYRKKYLKNMADTLLPKKVTWVGSKSMSKIPEIIMQADCLILPSHHDGWGVVASEALMVGTPVVCSNKCGSSIAVKASGEGGVFENNNLPSLTNILYNQFIKGKVSIEKRKKISNWAQCLGSNSGAKYLDLIINNNNKNLINPPWI